MSIPSSIPENPIIKNLESMVSKAHTEIDYWKGNHAKTLEENDSLKQEIKELKCKLKEKEE